MKADCSGHFSLVLRSPRGDRTLCDEARNLITDAGLNQMGAGAYITRCFLGNGTGESTESMTALESLVRTTTTVVSTNTSAQTSPPYYGSYTRVFRFAPDGTERIFSEVGVGWFSGLYARTLIRDISGNVNPITVLGDESLDVIYELRMYPPDGDLFSEVTSRGVTRALTIRASSVTSPGSWSPINAAATMNGSFDSYDGAIGAVTGLPSGVSSGLGNGDTASYAADSLEVAATLIVDPNTGNNPAGISVITTPANSGVGRYQISISPPISKTSLSYFRATFRAIWGRRS